MKTIKEINEKIKKGEVVVVTAEEVIELVDIRDALRFVSLTYSKRVYGPRGLDL